MFCCMTSITGTTVNHCDLFSSPSSLKTTQKRKNITIYIGDEIIWIHYVLQNSADWILPLNLSSCDDSNSFSYNSLTFLTVSPSNDIMIKEDRKWPNMLNAAG